MRLRRECRFPLQPTARRAVDRDRRRWCRPARPDTRGRSPARARLGHARAGRAMPRRSASSRWPARARNSVRLRTCRSQSATSRCCLTARRSWYQSLASSASRVKSARTSGWLASLPSYCPVRHDVEQRLERRAGVLDACRPRSRPRATRCCASTMLLHAVGEDRRVLDLGPEDLLGEDRGRVVEHPAEEGVHELGGDAVAEPAGQHRACPSNSKSSSCSRWPASISRFGSRSCGNRRHQISGTSRLMSWSTR